jgi:hypothetical protein
LPVTVGTLALGGQAATLRMRRGLATEAGLLDLNGRMVDLIYTQRVHYKLPSECGVVRLNGINVDLRTQRRPPKPQMLNFGHTAYLR